jgi:hypothetical protein
MRSSMTKRDRHEVINDKTGQTSPLREVFLCLKKEGKIMSKHSKKDSSGPTRVRPESMQRMLDEHGATEAPPLKGVRMLVYPNPKGRPQKPKSPEKDSTQEEA